jgi:uncharacterized protein
MIDWPLVGTFVLQWFTLAAILLGLVGLIVPIFPGLLVIWVATLIYGLVGHAFDLKGWILFGLITVLMLVGGAVDNVLIGAKARASGAAWASIWVSYAAGLVGSLFFTPLIGLLCAPLGLFVAEYVHRRDWRAALKTVGALLVGWGWAFGIRLIIGLFMTGLWMLWAWT